MIETSTTIEMRYKGLCDGGAVAEMETRLKL